MGVCFTLGDRRGESNTIPLGDSFRLPHGFLGRLQYLAANRYDLDGLTVSLSQEFQRRRCCTSQAIASIAAAHNIAIVVFDDDHPAGRRGPASKGEVVATVDRFGEPRKHLPTFGCNEEADCEPMPPLAQASERAGGRKQAIVYRRSRHHHAASLPIHDKQD